MSVNRLNFGQNEQQDTAAAGETPHQKLLRLVAQLPASARLIFNADFRRSLELTGQVVIEMATAGPRVIDPRRIMVAHRGPPPEAEEQPFTEH